MPYDFELTFTGLVVLTFFGADKTKPDEVDVLIVKSDAPHADRARHEHHHGHGGPFPAHFPKLVFTPARDFRPAAESDAHYSLVPTPDGRQLGIADVHGDVALEFDSEETNVPRDLVARWRPADVPERPVPDDGHPEQLEWLDWAPMLRKVNPNIKDASSSAPYAGLKPDLVMGRLRIDRGILKAVNLIRRPDGRFVIWNFKSEVEGEPPVGRQALASGVALRMSGLTEPITLKGRPFGVLRLAGVRDGELVQASISNLPSEETPKSDRLEHFAHFYDLTPFSDIPRFDLVPEREGIADTSSGSDCPGAIHMRFP